jgi:hypothetical protein
MGDTRNAYKSLVGKCEGKRSVERPRCTWMDNIKMDLKEIVSVCENRVYLAQDRIQ